MLRSKVLRELTKLTVLVLELNFFALEKTPEKSSFN